MNTEPRRARWSIGSIVGFRMNRAGMGSVSSLAAPLHKHQADVAAIDGAIAIEVEDRITAVPGGKEQAEVSPFDFTVTVEVTATGLLVGAVIRISIAIGVGTEVAEAVVAVVRPITIDDFSGVSAEDGSADVDQR